MDKKEAVILRAPLLAKGERKDDSTGITSNKKC